MSQERQLERSVLERKERDELQAIAEAMDLKPGSRARKADIIDKILQAAGVEVPSAEAASTNGEKPARATRSSARPAGPAEPADRAGEP